MLRDEFTSPDAFRQYCRDWIEANRPPPTQLPLPQAAYEVTHPDHRDYLVAWQRACYDAGLIATDVSPYSGDTSLA